MISRLARYFVILLVIAISACNVPTSASPTDTKPPDTPVPPTETSAPPTETATPTEIPPLYQGFWAKDGDVLRAYDFNGNPLGTEISITGALNWIGVDQLQVLGNTAYYYNNDAQQVYTSTAGGSPAPVAFIPSNISVTFLVSPDGSKIAWASDGWDTTANKPFSEMWVANIDGSGAVNVANIAAVSNEAFHVLMPYRWINDHEFLYAYNMTGIGGYILFWGTAKMSRLDINTGISTELVGANYFICLSEISPDQTKIFTTCEPDGGGDRVNKIVSLLPGGAVLTLPDLTDQGQSGSARFSPSGEWIAYAVARGDMGGERGQAAVIPADGSAAPLVVADCEPGYFNVAGWTGEDTLLLTKYDLSGSGVERDTIWKVNRDGSGLTQVGIGFFAGFITP
jgi:hypothetical protein